VIPITGSVSGIPTALALSNTIRASVGHVAAIGRSWLGLVDLNTDAAPPPIAVILTVIGGGSSQWMINLMKDVYLLDAAEGGEIRLVDPDQPGAAAVASMLQRFNRERRKDYSISVVDDRAEALAGADFVMTTFSPGSMDAFEYDLEVPIRYGIRQPVSMTVGPAGISASLRTVPVAYEIVQDMERQCPDAWLLNVTNRMSTVTRAMNLAANSVRVVGLCHEFHSFAALAREIFGLQPPPDTNVVEQLYQWLPERGLDYTVAGINHFIWITRAELDGRDVIPRICALRARSCRPA
jgi:alpha-galactosidase